MVFQLLKPVVSLINMGHRLTLIYKTNIGTSSVDELWVEGRFYSSLALSSTFMLVPQMFHRDQFINHCAREEGTKALETN